MHCVGHNFVSQLNLKQSNDVKVKRLNTFYCIFVIEKSVTEIIKLTKVKRIYLN